MFLSAPQSSDERGWRLILVALGVRIAQAAFFARRPGSTADLLESWGKISGDTTSYIEPIENLIASAVYLPDYRMPGYGAPYLGLRLLLDQPAALNVLLGFQVLLSAVSVYALARLARACFGETALFWFVFCVYCLSTYSAIYDVYLATESFATSSLVIGFGVFVGARGSTARLLIAGTFLAWSVFLRPALGGLLPILGTALFAGPGAARKERPVRRATAVAVFLLPFAFFDSLWIGRNYQAHGVIQPLVSRYAPYYGDVERSLFQFLQAWGGSLVHWNPKAEIVWFEHMTSRDYVVPSEAVRAIRFPPDIYTSRFNLESLIGLKQRLRQAREPGLSRAERQHLRTALATELDEYADSIRRERPFVYYVIAPLRILRRFLLHSGTYNLLGKTLPELNGWELLMKGIMTGLYWWVLAAGSIGALLVVRTQGLALWSGTLMTLIVLYVIGVHTLVLRLDEYRYFVPAYPFALCLASRATLVALQALRRKTASRIILRHTPLNG